MTFIGADNRFQTQASVCCCSCAVAAAACGQLKLDVKLAQSAVGWIHCVDGRTLDAASARVFLYKELQFKIALRLFLSSRKVSCHKKLLFLDQFKMMTNPAHIFGMNFNFAKKKIFRGKYLYLAPQRAELF
jgi:hypothetical protein